MRTRIRSVLASGKIRKVLLLGMVTVAMVIPGNVAACGQSSPGGVGQVPLFTAIDLHPSGFAYSKALGISGGEQVGYGDLAYGGHHALLWRGSAASVVDLHPRGYDGSVAQGVSGGHQVGSGTGPATGGLSHALMWSGSAGSMMDLHPKSFTQSYAFGISGGQQVGYGSLGNPGNEPANSHHALLWSGSAASVMDLHPSGYASSSEALGISGDQQVGWGRIAVPGGNDHALLWRGSAGSMVDLHPSGFAESEANGTSGGQQVGFGRRTLGVGPPPTYTLLWRGSAGSAVGLPPSGYLPRAVATSGAEQVGDDGGYPNPHAVLWSDSAVVDLHAFLPPGFVSSSATGIDSNGDIVGYAAVSDNDRDSTHAFLWKRNVNVKPAPDLPVDKGVAPQDLTTPKALVITSDDAGYILTDPQGRRTGYDPVHNMSYHDIPGAVYRTDSYPCGPFPTILEMANRLAGRYTLDVFGNGDFKVYVSAWGVSGHWRTYSLEGTGAPGVSSRFTFPGEVTTFAAFEAALKIDSTSDAFEVNGTFTLGPGGTISPATQDVTIEVEGYFLGTIPAGSFRQTGHGPFVFKGVIDGVALEATLMPTGVNSDAFKIEGANVGEIEGTKATEQMGWFGAARATQPDSHVKVELVIGNAGGSASVHSEFVH